MNAIELLDIIALGETSKVQFKREITHNDAMAAEMVAMSNSLGGVILLGVGDETGDIIGIDEVKKVNERLANIATSHISPPVYITTEIVQVNNELKSKILVLNISEGINKPYKDKNGAIWVKQGSDKRRVTDNNEILRLFQASKNYTADEMEVDGTSVNDIDTIFFSEYFKNEFEKPFEEMGLTLEKALSAKRILRNSRLTLGGLLFFGKEPQTIRPAFTIKAVSYFGNDSAGNQYRSKPNDLTGSIPILYKKAVDFLKSNLSFLQSGDSFNSQGKLEISLIAIEEILQNALIHRDYFKNSPIRLLVFDNRLEIISPGKLPNSLTVDDIKYGNPVIRNNQILSFSLKTLKVSGLGTGIKRAMTEQPNIEFINQEQGEQFIVIIPRPSK